MSPLAAAIVGGVLWSCLLLPATSASASGPGSGPADIVEVSPDGVTFTKQFSGLFDGTVLVPRDSSRDTFFVRNSGTEPGYLRIVLADVVSSDPLMRSATSISSTVLGATGGFVSLDDASPCVQLVGEVALAGGQTAQVSTELVLGDLTGLQAQNASLAFALQIELSESPIDSNSCASARPGGETLLPLPPPNSPLAATGTNLDWMIVTAIAIFSTGLAIIITRKRRKRDAE
ncbi:hypothetical protein ACPPVQ_04425 [Diaminobutyricibacter sp. McL0618]|uniref:hypothetical protein n=1 Tax=Leifsonia sp. McL0618 TaxID=3415677 RepID=UPI003CFA6437